MRSRWIAVRWVLVLVVAGACVVTRAPQMDERPRWTLDNPAWWSGSCALGKPFIRKSGKQGFGVSLELRSTGDCTISITGGRLVLPGKTVTLPPIAIVNLKGRSLVHQWVPVRFDNDEAWDEHRNDGTLELAIVAGGVASTWSIGVVQK